MFVSRNKPKYQYYQLCSIFMKLIDEENMNHNIATLQNVPLCSPQEVVSASCSCVIAAAARCRRQGGGDEGTAQGVIVREFHSCLQQIIKGCMQKGAIILFRLYCYLDYLYFNTCFVSKLARSHRKNCKHCKNGLKFFIKNHVTKLKIMYRYIIF